MGDETNRHKLAGIAFFLTDLHVAHPELKIQRGEVKTLTVGETAPLLDEHTALVEYFVGEAATYMFVLTKGKGRAAPVTLNVFTINAGREELGRAASSFQAWPTVRVR